MIDERKVRVRAAELGVYNTEALIAKTGITGRTLRKLFAGGDFKRDTLVKLAGALECNPLDLLSTDVVAVSQQHAREAYAVA
jgi:DNA-binding Xre family transcriptional regulator